ncbi:MAG: CotH kinase family protein [Sphaerochaetaceae bacterium]|nr:CotH kinase family protein [Sphaerochaetaceae bacterium]
MWGDSLGISATAKSMKYEKTLFDTSYVHKIDIVMDNWDAFITNCESEDYSLCTVVIDGKKYSNIAIRAKGNTSLSTVRTMGSQRYSFKLEFDHYEEGKSCDGLDKLCLNNLIQDNTMMKDYIVYQLMNDFGVDSPLCSFTYITVNGEDWGLYLAVEGIEDSFLYRNYGSDVGELYKPDSMSFGGGRGNGKGFNMDDFDFDFSNSALENKTDTTIKEQPQMPGGNSQQFDFSQMSNEDFQQGSFPQMPNNNMFQGSMPQMSGDNSQQFSFSQFGGMGSSDVKLQYIDDNPDSYSNIFDNAKTDVSSTDEQRLISSLKSLSEYSNLENILDIDEVLRYFVVHNFVCNGDSYTGTMIHNYYLHEKDSKLAMIPWDYNLAFGTFQGGNASSTVNSSIDEVLSDRPMQAWIFSDQEYTAQYHSLFAEFIEKWFTNGELSLLIEKTADLIRPYVEKDPSKFCTTEEFEKGVNTLSQFVNLRGEAVSRQLEGNTTTVNTSSLNLSDMGSMGGGFGGGNNRNFNTSSFANISPSNDTIIDPSSFDPSTMGQFGFENNLSNNTDFSFPNSGEIQKGNKATRDNTKTPSRNEIGSQPNLPTIEENTNDSFDMFSFGKNNGQNSLPTNENMDLSFPGGSFPNNQFNSSDSTKWILIGFSVFVLVVGLFIAIKKKY